MTALKRRKIVFNGWGLSNSELHGIHRYTSQLLQELDRLVRSGVVELAVPKDAKPQFALNNIAITEVDGCWSKLGKYGWNQLAFPFYARGTGVGVDSVLGLPIIGCTAACLYDCIVERYPEDARGMRHRIGRRTYLLQAAKTVRNSSVIITDSQSAKADICRWYGCDSSKIAVVPCAWQHIERIDQDDTVIERFSLERGAYFFSLASGYYHKNLKWVAAAARLNPQCQFVIAGSDTLSMGYGAPDGRRIPNIVYTGYLSDAEVKALMASCRAFIQPSLCEGFGIPPMEAMAVGANCILSDIDVFHEIYGDSVWYVDPCDYDHIALEEIMGVELREPKEAVLSRYSWQSSARQLFEVLKYYATGVSCLP